VTGEIRKHPRPRARGVADLPIDALLARAEEIARRWAVMLILERPLAQIGELPLEELAREAPALCAQAIRALASDAELERLLDVEPSSTRQGSPALRLAAIAGARDARAAVEATEALRGVLWEALLEELSGPSFEQAPGRELAELSDRLATVCASALRASLPLGLPAAAAAPAGARRVVVASAGAAVEHPGPGASGSEHAASQRAVIIDERAPEQITSPLPSPRFASEPSASPAAGAPPLVGEEPSPPRAPEQSHAGEPPRSWQRFPPPPARRDQSEIEIRDERGEGPAAWINSIGRQLERFEDDGLPFAVLLVEILEIERVLAERSTVEASVLADRVEEAIAQLRPSAGSLTRERAGRYWLLAPHTDRVEAGLLAERVVSSIGSSSAVALDVALGMAVCPDDGREAAALAAYADVELYAARSAISRSSAPLE
jgi:hypothetical protein